MKSLGFSLLLVIYYSIACSQQTTDTLLIHFDYNQSIITPPAAAILDSFLAANPITTITQINLAGHCDFIGSHVYNDSLSLQRVKATREYLVNKGLSPALFSNETGWGKHKPLMVATTYAARAINRRVEVIFNKQIPVKTAVPVVEEPVMVTTPPTLSDIIKDSTTQAGSTLVLPNMHFAPGRHVLLQHSYPVLQQLLDAMRNNPGLQIEIHGHICCLSGGADGPDTDLGTHDLSVQRAKFIYNYLVKEGISPSRMSYKGFGSSRKLVFDERTETAATKNRRVEIKIVSK